MKPVLIEVPEDVSDAIRLPLREQPDRLHLELALSLHAQDLLSLGKAAELASRDRHSFSAELGRRNIVRHYTDEDLADDLRYARGQ